MRSRPCHVPCMARFMISVLVGLGNPGESHARQRHNIGFMAIEAIAAAHGFPPFAARHQGRISSKWLARKKRILFQPQTFMNESGRALAQLLRFYRLQAGAVMVFHDELDLPFGKCRIKQGGGTAGHNGLESLARGIGADFWRVRLGIGHPGARSAVTRHVLGDFAASERAPLARWLAALAAEAPLLLTGRTDEAQNRLHEAMR